MLCIFVQIFKKNNETKVFDSISYDHKEFLHKHEINLQRVDITAQYHILQKSLSWFFKFNLTFHSLWKHDSISITAAFSV